MKRFTWPVLLILVSCLADVFIDASSEAAVQGTITLMRDPTIGVPFTSPDATLSAPWVSYALGLRSTAGELLSAFDFTLSHPQLHQRWIGDGDGGFTPTANETSFSNGDSHLRAGAGALFGSGPTEDNSSVGSPLADTGFGDYGLGTSLSGAWGIPLVGTNPSLAYVVIPEGTEHLLDIRVKTVDVAGQILADLSEADFLSVAPTIRVEGNGLEIVSGDNTPRPEDGTDFGLDGLGETERRIYEIRNTSLVPLALGPPTLTGPFVLEGDAFPNTVLPGASASFNVLMHRDSPGSFLGSIGFGTNAGRYEFALAGQTVPEPTANGLCGSALVGLVLVCRWR